MKSNLINVEIYSPNMTSPRKKPIDTITIHMVCGQCSPEVVGEIFSRPSRHASSNYGIGPDGRIGLFVDEANRSWCSSSSANDDRAITIEVASDKTAPFAVKDAAYKSLIALCADICKRNGIKKLVWSDSKDDRVNHKNGCNMTVHKDFADTSCPGEYLYNHMQDIANRVNAIIEEGGQGGTLPVNDRNYSKTEFIEKIASVAKNLIGNYGISVISPIIAQACNESAFGQSEKSKYFNFFGLKYRPNRVPCSCGKFIDTTKEQKHDGSYVASTTEWFAFDSFETAVEGYLQFINIERYKNLKGVTDPKVYTELIKVDGYATSILYVNTIMNLIKELDLTKYDPKPEKKSIDEIAQEVILGKWDNYPKRKKLLEAAGYNYGEVQALVNQLCAHATKKSNEAIAKEVIQGKWGNYPERKQKLEKAGYNYGEVQSLVNKMLKK